MENTVQQPNSASVSSTQVQETQAPVTNSGSTFVNPPQVKKSNTTRNVIIVLVALLLICCVCCSAMFYIGYEQSKTTAKNTLETSTKDIATAKSDLDKLEKFLANSKPVLTDFNNAITSADSYDKTSAKIKADIASFKYTQSISYLNALTDYIDNGDKISAMSRDYAKFSIIYKDYNDIESRTKDNPTELERQLPVYINKINTFVSEADDKNTIEVAKAFLAYLRLNVDYLDYQLTESEYKKKLLTVQNDYENTLTKLENEGTKLMNNSKDLYNKLQEAEKSYRKQYGA